MIGVDFNFDEYPTLLALARDNSHVRIVIGPAGSAKTSGMVALLLHMAMQQYPGKDGVRRVKTAVVRQTYQQLIKSTVASIRTTLGDLVKITDGTPPTGKCVMPMPDGTTLRWDLVFYALDSPNAESDALGAEYTNIIIDEVSSVADEDLLLAFVSRIGRYPSMKYGDTNKDIVRVLGTTNGPRQNHWLYEWHTGARSAVFETMSRGINRPYFKLFQQPPALLQQPDGSWEENPLAENVANLSGGYGYYFGQLNRSPEHITAFVKGEFVPMATGQVVYRNFRHDMHVLQQDTFLQAWGKTGRIGLVFDFGRTPVCLAWADTRYGGVVVFAEYMAEDISVDGFWRDVIKPSLQADYPRCVFGKSGWVTGDPAGADMTQAVDQSPYSILEGHGLSMEFPADTRKDALGPRIEAVRQRLSRLDEVTGKPMLQVTSNCTFLINAMLTGYVYEGIRGSDSAVRDVPTKTHKGWASDLANALEYLCLYRRGELDSPTDRPPKRTPTPLFGG